LGLTVGWLSNSRNPTNPEIPNQGRLKNTIWENQTVSLGYGVPSNPIDHFFRRPILAKT
jgi:hypothetical protein